MLPQWLRPRSCRLQEPEALKVGDELHEGGTTCTPSKEQSATAPTDASLTAMARQVTAGQFTPHTLELALLGRDFAPQLKHAWLLHGTKLGGRGVPVRVGYSSPSQ